MANENTEISNRLNSLLKSTLKQRHLDLHSEVNSMFGANDTVKQEFENTEALLEIASNNKLDFNSKISQIKNNSQLADLNQYFNFLETAGKNKNPANFIFLNAVEDFFSKAEKNNIRLNIPNQNKKNLYQLAYIDANMTDDVSSIVDNLEKKYLELESYINKNRGLMLFNTDPEMILLQNLEASYKQFLIYKLSEDFSRAGLDSEIKISNKYNEMKNILTSKLADNHPRHNLILEALDSVENIFKNNLLQQRINQVKSIEPKFNVNVITAETIIDDYKSPDVKAQKQTSPVLEHFLRVSEIFDVAKLQAQKVGVYESEIAVYQSQIDDRKKYLANQKPELDNEEQIVLLTQFIQEKTTLLNRDIGFKIDANKIESQRQAEAEIRSQQAAIDNLQNLNKQVRTERENLSLILDKVKTFIDKLPQDLQDVKNPNFKSLIDYKNIIQNYLNSNINNNNLNQESEIHTEIKNINNLTIQADQKINAVKIDQANLDINKLKSANQKLLDSKKSPDSIIADINKTIGNEKNNIQNNLNQLSQVLNNALNTVISTQKEINSKLNVYHIPVIGFFAKLFSGDRFKQLSLKAEDLSGDKTVLDTSKKYIDDFASSKDNFNGDNFNDFKNLNAKNLKNISTDFQNPMDNISKSFVKIADEKNVQVLSQSQEQIINSQIKTNNSRIEILQNMIDSIKQTNELENTFQQAEDLDNSNQNILSSKK